ncbi:amidohydrolase family protein [Prauserella endophytica]|uniref:Amidohydrolase-related domain-containing protein n=1 Tax=Prauserella endophytica TaxID=1592324 RepID=A0ABY2S735_9PSEU|nr:amidohydrolase family protein [Prauserella endophytica]TKG71689.1 hypothetical protein FCN18_09225 [Prauserella endophytica]
MTVPFADSHVHFFDLTHPELAYTWLRRGGDPDETAIVGEYGAIRSERYHAYDFQGETRFADVRYVVHVQAALGTADPVAETAWLDQQHHETGLPHAMVAAADLASDQLVDTLDRHGRWNRFAGIRDLREDDYLYQDAWLEGLRELERRALVCCDAPRIDDVRQLLKVLAEVPDLTYCLDHALMPDGSDEGFPTWRQAIGALAEAPGTILKISGLGMMDHRWTPESLRRWVHTGIEVFGPDRVIFGTNWPLDRLYSSYGDVVDFYRTATASFGPDAQRRLLFDNTVRIFGGGS